MIGSCAGLPLAIIVLGGLLATKETLSEWDMVRRNIKSYLARAKGIMGQQARLFEVLALSYHELPYQLKPCFLYMSQFPEDFDIPTKKLVQQWVAEGIVSAAQDDMEMRDEIVEDVARGYLHDLINRCMVEVGAMGSTGTIKTCRLHDLMRDLCLSKARQENFIRIIDHGHGHGNENDVGLPSFMDSTTMSDNRIRRCAIYLSRHVEGPILPKFKKNPKLRSLFFFQAKKSGLNDGQLLESMFHEFKLLKVLDLEGIGGLLEKLPEDIGTLIQLRFLSLKETRVRELPSSLINLECLQTLNLQTMHKFDWEPKVGVPNVIWKMRQLRHLYLPKWCGNRLQLANLSNLQTLVNFPGNELCHVKDLLTLTNLRKLVLNDPKHFETFTQIFDNQTTSLVYLTKSLQASPRRTNKEHSAT